MNLKKKLWQVHYFVYTAYIVSIHFHLLLDYAVVVIVRQQKIRQLCFIFLFIYYVEKSDKVVKIRVFKYKSFAKNRCIQTNSTVQ